MRTTVTLDAALVGELLKHSRARTKTAAVTEAVREQVRRIKLEKLSGLRGKIEFQSDPLTAGERADLAREDFLGELSEVDPDAE